jgi:hypothetical protein
VRRGFHDQSGEHIVGVGVEITGWHRQSLVVYRCHQIGLAELMVQVGRHRVGDRHRLAVVGNVTGHIQQGANFHVPPRGILRKPVTDRLIQIEQALCFQFQDQSSREMLCVAANLEQRIRAKRRSVATVVSSKKINLIGAADVNVKREIFFLWRPVSQDSFCQLFKLLGQFDFTGSS